MFVHHVKEMGPCMAVMGVAWAYITYLLSCLCVICFLVSVSWNIIQFIDVFNEFHIEILGWDSSELL